MSAPTDTAKARADLRAALEGLDLPERSSACALCGRTAKGRGTAKRTEIITMTEDDGPVPSGWRETKRRRYNVNDVGQPAAFVTELTFERVWRVCRDCRFAHELDPDPQAHSWPVIAVLAALGYERTVPMMAMRGEQEYQVMTWPPELVADARRVVRALGSFAYRHHGVPADPGAARAWAHLDVDILGRARRMFQEAAEARAFEAEYGRQSPSKTPCCVCGVTHAKEWGEPPRPESSGRYPEGLEVCGICADQWALHREGTLGFTFLDWAASAAAGVVGARKGLGARVAFVLANRHPSFTKASGYRPPWHYLDAADREALSQYVRGLAPAPSPDGRLKIPVAS